jgi:hypothetical protein
VCGRCVLDRLLRWGGGRRGGLLGIAAEDSADEVGIARGDGLLLDGAIGGVCGLGEGVVGRGRTCRRRGTGLRAIDGAIGIPLGDHAFAWRRGAVSRRLARIHGTGIGLELGGIAGGCAGGGRFVAWGRGSARCWRALTLVALSRASLLLGEVAGELLQPGGLGPLWRWRIASGWLLLLLLLLWLGLLLLRLL